LLPRIYCEKAQLTTDVQDTNTFVKSGVCIIACLGYVKTKYVDAVADLQFLDNMLMSPVYMGFNYSENITLKLDVKQQT